MTRPAAHYIPIRRPGVRCSWPPDDTWTLADLVAEMQFWRTLSHLMPYTVNAHTPVPAPPAIPAQRGLSVAAAQERDRMAAARARRDQQKRGVR